MNVDEIIKAVDEKIIELETKFSKGQIYKVSINPIVSFYNGEFVVAYYKEPTRNQKMDCIGRAGYKPLENGKEIFEKNIIIEESNPIYLDDKDIYNDELTEILTGVYSDVYTKASKIQFNKYSSLSDDERELLDEKVVELTNTYKRKINVCVNEYNGNYIYCFFKTPDRVQIMDTIGRGGRNPLHTAQTLLMVNILRNDSNTIYLDMNPEYDAINCGAFREIYNAGNKITGNLYKKKQ